MSVFMQDAEEYVDEMGLPEEQKHTLLSQFRTKEAEGITDVEEAMRSICVDMGMPEDDARATELRASQPQICVASIPTDRLEACVRARFERLRAEGTLGGGRDRRIPGFPGWPGKYLVFTWFYQVFY